MMRAYYGCSTLDSVHCVAPACLAAKAFSDATSRLPNSVPRNTYARPGIIEGSMCVFVNSVLAGLSLATCVTGVLMLPIVLPDNLACLPTSGDSP